MFRPYGHEVLHYTDGTEFDLKEAYPKTF